MANDQVYKRLAALLLSLALLASCTSIGTPVVTERSSGASLTPSGQYIVRKGDTLYSIAWRLGVDYKSLARVNGIDEPFTIFPGQKLRLRAKLTTKKAKPVVAKTTTVKKSPASLSNTKPASTSKPTVASKPKAQPKRKSEPALRKPAATVAAKKPAAPNRKLSSKWAWPVKQKPISAYGKGSNGLDYAIVRRTNVMAAGLGEVVYAGNGIAGFERLVIVKHSGNLLSAYSFNGRVLVNEQQRIGSGMRLAEILPRPGVGQKLHFELRRDGNPINPGSVIR
ncbi:MAG: peptidoglycan DD-metalloendopeptidase family protein [Pseudomonadales bacterium]|nr:peptidoglycan DD-metalloendopeptidase family protein [Pseudomonadales bacterium]